MKRLVALCTAVAILIFLSSCVENIDELFASSSTDESGYYDDTDFDASALPPILKIGLSGLSGYCNPLFFNNSADENVIKLFSVSLLDFDENEIAKDSISTYEMTNFDDGSVVCRFKIRENVLFCDGETLNTDDVIFTMYVLSDPSYDGRFNFNSLPICGMDKYRSGSSDLIDGIVRIDDYTFEICLKYYDSDFVSLMSFPILPLHHYGNVELYDYVQNKFGFLKGDLAPIKAINHNSLGAGPYDISEYKDGVIYLSRHKTYYKGEPKIPLLEIYDTTGMSNSEMIDLLSDGAFDIVNTVYNVDIIDSISRINKGEADGEYLKNFVIDNNAFGYIGICADTVKVGDDKDSVQSKNLRKAFATLFSAYRENAIEKYYGKGAEIVNYPVSDFSQSSAEIDISHRAVYSLDVNGNEIYQEGMSEEEIYASALEASKDYFVAAGFVFDDYLHKFVSAPDGASLRYSVIINANGVGDHPCYDIFINAQKAFLKLGIVLDIKDVENTGYLWDELENGTCQIWAAALNTEKNGDLFQIFHSSHLGKTNYYGIEDGVLDGLLYLDKTAGDDQKEQIQTECFDIIFDWGVIVPVYQRKDVLIVNAHTVNTDLIERELNGYGVWINDIHLFRKSFYG